MKIGTVFGSAAIVAALATTASPTAARWTGPPEAPFDFAPLLDWSGRGQPQPDTAWLFSGLAHSQRFQLTPGPASAWLERYLRPDSNNTPEWRRFWQGPYGSSSLHFTPLHSWSSAAFPAPEALNVTRSRPCPTWDTPKPVTVMRYAGETDRFALLDCHGGVAPEALDRLSVLARPPAAARPELPLPLEPMAGDEWLPEVRLLDPRLVWMTEKIAEAFPGHALVLMSGYRRDGHSGLHQKGKALDLYVYGVPNEQVFQVCQGLRDVGCGFYPNNHFVHVDVRPYGTHEVLWVDVSKPGEPSRYVDGWSGLVEPGKSWLGK